MGPPYKTADYDFMFASGVNSQGCLLDVAEALDLAIKKVGPAVGLVESQASC